MFSSMPARLDNSGWKMILGVCCMFDYGCLRTAKSMLELAYCSWQDETLSSDELTTILKMFFGRNGETIANSALRQADRCKDC